MKTTHNISAKALKAAKVALADAIEGTAVLAGVFETLKQISEDGICPLDSFRKNFSRKNLQEAKDCLSLPLLKIYNSVYFLAGELISRKNIDINLAQGHAPRKWAQHYGRNCCVSLAPLKCKVLSYKTV